MGALLGYEVDALTQVSNVHLWHKNDLKVYNEKIFPETMEFLKRQSFSDYPCFSFSFNYRVKTKEGNYLTLLERCIYQSPEKEDSPLIAIVRVADITNYKEDSRIIHTIENTHHFYNATAAETLFKFIYYPDKCYDILSKREVEILETIYRGLSSKEIANKLCISINTVNNHRKNMLLKTKTKNLAELLRYAQKNGLL